MKPFSNQDIADYYNQTIHHYKRWWKLNEQRCVHYGFWNEKTNSFSQALYQSMIEMAERSGLQQRSMVLDAGCGVGGASFFLADKYSAEVEGITLSQKQLNSANQNKGSRYPGVTFSLQDFTQTSFPSVKFDLIWACESSCYAFPKENFFKEARRLLKPGGRLVIADYFTTERAYERDRKGYLQKWADTWAISELYDENMIQPLSNEFRFKLIRNDDVTDQIRPSAKRMYLASLAGSLPSILYNLTHKVSHFGAIHYRSGFYQYQALKQGLWRYRMLVMEK